MKPKMTPWFPGEVNPVRVGVYERGEGGMPLPYPFYEWNGEFWAGSGSKSPNKMIHDRHRSIFQSIPWRGLAEDPAKAAP